VRSEERFVEWTGLCEICRKRPATIVTEDIRVCAECYDKLWEDCEEEGEE